MPCSRACGGCSVRVSSPLNVLFLTLYPPSVASPRYRVEQFLPYLREHGFRCTVESAVTEEALRSRSRPFWYHAQETPRRIAQLFRAQRYELVVVQKSLASAYVRGLHMLLRECAKHLVYDIDDAVHQFPPHPLRGVWRVLQDGRQVLRIFEEADLVLAGNGWLCNEARHYARRVEYFPTVVDTDRFTPRLRKDDALIVGWIGSPSTTPHLRTAGPLGEMEDLTLRCVGADRAAVPWKHAEVRPWSYETEVDELRAFAVGIMPLPRDEWARGKCGLKALQYMACGVPCVATPYGAALEIISNNVNGLFADLPEQWRAAIECLRDPATRVRLGDAGRETVEARYSLKSAAPKLVQLLESVV